jgi:hypothetical protein
MGADEVDVTAFAAAGPIRDKQGAGRDSRRIKTDHPAGSAPATTRGRVQTWFATPTSSIDAPTSNIDRVAGDEMNDAAPISPKTTIHGTLLTGAATTDRGNVRRAHCRRSTSSTTTASTAGCTSSDKAAARTAAPRPRK